ncbi:replication restart helicase PriA [Porcincola intestinalis]|uniref:replication restart helicase PriA n=1 Tax=Porcincola intestinalis TaxID=2606632 RepID=UPI002A836477|nr:primosomal protein N' [Porcincola intestinalis]MDY4205561.1 primosomal protein N' [Porcincola intestinalis]
MRFADVIVDISAHALDRSFQYRVPEELTGSCDVGTLVSVPFGKRTVTGYIVGFSDTPKIEEGKIRPLARVDNEATSEESRLTGLAVWIRDRYGSTFLQALHTVLPKKTKMKVRQQKRVTLAVSADEAWRAAAVCRVKKQKARERLLGALSEEETLPWEVVTQKLNVTPSVVRALAQKGLVRIESEDAYRTPELPEAFSHKGITLNAEQEKIVRAICSSWEEEPAGRYLIRGVTGSGKTEVYIELIAFTVEHGQQAIVLIPEIALTYQTLMRFYHRFGDRVSIIHSKMSAGERSDQFERARRGEIDVMIGPRSALFTPFEHLGMIVIDEEHEESYRSGQAPRYHAREVAFRRGEMEKAKVVLGSATPSLEASYAAERGLLKEFRLTQRAGGSVLPGVEVVDLRREKGVSDRTMIGRRLREAIQETLSRHEQAMLFLNRRGVASFVTCRTCGDVLKCPHCDVALTLHGRDRLVCHYCGYQTSLPDTCPSCGSPFLRTFKAGTEQIEREVRQLFPSAAVLRMDKDTTSGKDGQLEILSKFASHEADILIGTQMIVKGHDFPDVTLMGILAADLSLNVPDFRAAERTFQLLTQAAGRAGRAEKPGRVLIQTYQPDHYAIQCAARQDYDSFYRREMHYRMLSGYPPAGGLLQVHLSCTDKEQLEVAAAHLRGLLDRILSNVTTAVVLGPSDEAIGKIADVYHMAIYLKCPDRRVLRVSKDRMERYIGANEGFRTVDIQFDAD